jgi:peptidoglycan biosynthesis protein MviN/MurJ (putative lipid II flippase)
VCNIPNAVSCTVVLTHCLSFVVLSLSLHALLMSLFMAWNMYIPKSVSQYLSSRIVLLLSIEHNIGRDATPTLATHLKIILDQHLI